MLSFIIGCITLAICISFGFLLLHLAFFLLAMIWVGISSLVGTIYGFLTGRDHE